jgi:hypothetical protein
MWVQTTGSCFGTMAEVVIHVILANYSTHKRNADWLYKYQGRVQFDLTPTPTSLPLPQGGSSAGIRFELHSYRQVSQFSARLQSR